MTESKKLDELAGEVNALRAFCFAVINTHPDLGMLGNEFNRLSETAIGIATGHAVSEGYLKGLQQSCEELTSQILARIS